MPVITSRLPLLVVHALLDDHPFAVVGDDEAVQVKVETILDGGAVDLGHQLAGLSECSAIDADAIADGDQLVRRLPRVPAAPAADMDAEFARHRGEPPLQGAYDTGGDAGRMPIHAHHGSEGLEPERM